MEEDKWGKIVRLNKMRREVQKVHDDVLAFKYIYGLEKEHKKAEDNLREVLQELEKETVELLASYTEEDKK